MMDKYDEAMLATAKLFGNLSYCIKAKVGAIIARDGRVLATGYNGTVSGHDNCCEIEINGVLKTSPFTVHAEQNVISYCAKNGISTYGATMYITLSPCQLCAKLIVQAGIKRVVFLDLYKDTSGLEFLKDCNIEILNGVQNEYIR